MYPRQALVKNVRYTRKMTAILENRQICDGKKLDRISAKEV
jgi:hypothetical protein